MLCRPAFLLDRLDHSDCFLLRSEDGMLFRITATQTKVGHFYWLPTPPYPPCPYPGDERDSFRLKQSRQTNQHQPTDSA